MKLIAITAELLNRVEIYSSEYLTGICQVTLAMYSGSGPVHPWVGYLAAFEGIFMGTCAFKTPPQDGCVEIAYFTFPEYQGRGVATQMAAALLTIAGRAGIDEVRAQTLPEVSASTRILKKLGFTKMGNVIHPEDGEVWEWHRRNDVTERICDA